MIIKKKEKKKGQKEKIILKGERASERFLKIIKGTIKLVSNLKERKKESQERKKERKNSQNQQVTKC